MSETLHSDQSKHIATLNSILNNNKLQTSHEIMKKYIVLFEDKNVYSGRFSPEIKLNYVRKDLELTLKDIDFIFLDKENIPILKENENDINLEELVNKDEIIKISSELCSPDSKKLLLFAIFAFILMILISLAIYNPENFVIIYIACILLGLSIRK